VKLPAPDRIPSIMEHLMDQELRILDNATDEPLPIYKFVIDADLVHVGGGSSVLEY
jgi:hypothetical protein